MLAVGAGGDVACGYSEDRADDEVDGGDFVAVEEAPDSEGDADGEEDAVEPESGAGVSEELRRLGRYGLTHYLLLRYVSISAIWRFWASIDDPPWLGLT